MRRIAVLLGIVLLMPRVAWAGEGSRFYREASAPFEAPSFEIAVESAYLMGIIGNPNSYEIASAFLTARWRLGVIEDPDSWLRGYNQVYLLAMVQPILRGPENIYAGISTGFRYNFVRPGWAVVPFISGGVGAGYIDSNPGIEGAQGQDFTFNILTAFGVSWKISERMKFEASLLYEHLSNAGQTDPNPSLNLLGPQVGLSWQF